MENIKKRKTIKLLIFSYHYLPLNVIASYRPAGFAQHLYKFGIYPTIITHRWEPDEKRKWILHKKNDKVIVEKNDQYQVIRLPRYHTFQGNLFRLFEKFPLIRKLLIVFRWLTGYLDPGPHNTDSYIAYKKFLFNHLKTNSYDMVMGIYSPHHHLRLCYEINKKFGIPYILDFRDLWDNSATGPDYRPKGQYKLYVKQIKKYWAKWLSKAEFFTTLSEPWIDKIREITLTQGHIVMHGYDEDIAVIQKINPSKDEFIVLYVGSLYKNQDVEGFLKGVKLFVEKTKPNKFKVVFLGSKRRNMKRNKNTFENIEVIFEEYFYNSKCVITERVPRDDVLKLYEKASLLISLTYKNFQGTYSGKFFEYVGTGRPILVYGEKDSIIAKAVTEDQLGFVCTNSSEVSNELVNAYTKWKNKKSKIKMSYFVGKYSRYNQSGILAEYLMTIKRN